MLIQDLAAQGERGAGGGAGSAGGETSGGGLPEMANLGAPGLISTRIWVWKMVRDMRKPLEPKAGFGRCLGGGCDGGGGATRRGSPERTRLGRGGCWDVCATGSGRTHKARHALWYTQRDLTYSVEGSSLWCGGAGSLACGARPPKGRYGLRKTAQRKRGVGVVLT